MDISVVNMEEFTRNLDNESPFVMLNLLKFKTDDGFDRYKRYLANASGIVSDVGARVIYMGKPNEMLQGQETWDFIMLVEYPSRKAFMEMINNHAYQEIHKDRISSTERAVLYVTEPLPSKTVVKGSK
ncbi:DUF1330 domain-containing protein [Desulfosporosinus sp. HMP52]|uniref:DUF1330 domain-containing protein n=1 Tax=Desulfosporosinus sp. HMP52 TaxID=1487923 RepID=UPI00068ABADD|nr:DUF1330 domain-containing protein [Desulfosporosinus sp. HMP52]